MTQEASLDEGEHSARVGTPLLHAKNVQQDWDVIVVGSGPGGLGAAVMLAKHVGKRVLVLEKHYTAGGFTHVFRRKRFEWDVGVHYIGEMQHERSLLRRVFHDLSGGRLGWADMGDVYDRIIMPDKTYDFPKGREALSAMLHREFPNETRAIDDYFQTVRVACHASAVFFRDKMLTPLISNTAGRWMRRSFNQWSDRTTREVILSLGASERLLGVLTGQYGDYGLPPAESSFAVHAMLVRHYFGGGNYPIGGASSIGREFTRELEAHGGAVFTNAGVAEILVERGRAVGVRTESGQEFRAPWVISAAGIATTFTHLLPNTDKAPLATVSSIGRSAAHLCLYVGLNATDEELGLQKANLWVYPSYNHDESVTQFLKDPKKDFPLVYISFPSAKDPTFASRYPGRSTIEVVTLAEPSWFSTWEGTRWHKRGAEYEALKSDFAERLQAVLEHHVPQVRGHIEHAELSTPLSTAHFTGYASGEIYGLKHSPERFRQTSLRPRTQIKGLVLAGQDVATCGVTGGLVGGILAASVVGGVGLLERYRRG